MLLPLAVLSQLTANAHGSLAALTRLADVPNPPPAAPGPGSGAVAALLAWVKWLALAACAASAAAAGGMIAVGSVTRRAELAARGKASLLWSVVGAVVVAIAVPLVNHAFRLG